MWNILEENARSFSFVKTENRNNPLSSSEYKCGTFK